MEINKEQIKSLLKSGTHVEEIDDLTEIFSLDGYFIGVFMNRIFVQAGNTIYAVWVRPYHIDFFKNIDIDIDQRLTIKCGGLRKNPETCNKYFHLQFTPRMSYKMTTQE